MLDAVSATNVYFRLLYQGSIVAGWPKTLSGQNVNINITPVFWGDATDVSLSGNKRSNIRGFDLSLSVNFSASLEQNKVEEILEGFVNLIDPEYELTVDLGSGEYFHVYPTDSTNVRIQYRDTIRTAGENGVIPTFEFEADQYFSDIGQFYAP